MKKILLASQYRTLLQKHSNLLANWKFKVFTATSGSEALKLHKEHNFDLIVSDFELEGMCISTLFTLIHKDTHAQRVPLIITCHDLPDSIQRAKSIGASDIIVKPIDPIKLLEVIGNHIGLKLIRGKRVEIKVVVKIKKDGHEFICQSRNISNTGILIKSDYALQIGDQLDCTFTLPDYHSPVEAFGEVVRYMTDAECEDLYGINFVSISASHLKAIIDYIYSPSIAHFISKTTKSESYIFNKDTRRIIEKTRQIPEE